MLVDTQNLVPISEANQSFSRVARMADERGSVVILRNNKPSYVLTTFNQASHDKNEQDDVFDPEYVTQLGRQLIDQHRATLEALAH